MTWSELEELLLKEYADEGTTIEVMRSLVKLVQLKDETSGELGAKAEKLAPMAFPKEFRNNAAMQAQLADLYVKALQGERVWDNVIK